MTHIRVMDQHRTLFVSCYTLFIMRSPTLFEMQFKINVTKQITE